MRSTDARFTAFGATLSVRTSDETALAHAIMRLRWLGWRKTDDGASDVTYQLRRRTPDGTTPRSSYELRCNRRRLFATDDLAQLLDAFEHHAKLLTATRAQGRLFVHAGAVSWRGRGILIPGRSMSGKTTLVRALVDAGALYFSDEFAVLDRDGRLHPYSLPLNIRGTPSQPAARLTIDEAGGRAATRPADVAIVVVTQYRRYARWRPRPLSAGQALLALMENTVAARRSPRVAMEVLRRAVTSARAIETVRGDARRAADALTGLV